MMPPDASRLFEDEIFRLKRSISQRRSTMQEKRSERDILKNENAHLNATFAQSKHTLADRQSTLFSLEFREAELSGKMIGLDYLIKAIEVKNICRYMLIDMFCCNRILRGASLKRGKEIIKEA